MKLFSAETFQLKGRDARRGRGISDALVKEGRGKWCPSKAYTSVPLSFSVARPGPADAGSRGPWVRVGGQGVSRRSTFSRASRVGGRREGARGRSRGK